MFEVLTRNTPYRGLKQEEIRTQVVNFGLRPNVELVSQECPKTLRSLMVLCWSENPDDRPCFEKIADILDTVKSQKK
jgi:hypothetical protein